MANATTMSPVQQEAFIYLSIITPIEDIIEGLESGRFTDKSLGYLNERLKLFTELAAKVLKQESHIWETPIDAAFLNDYVKAAFVNDFKAIQGFFKRWLDSAQPE